MSKLITDSKVLSDLLIDEDGIIENTNAYFLIERLKEAVLSCSELCVTIEFEDFAETRKRLGDINLVLSETWRTLAELQNDFKDTYKPKTNESNPT